MRGSRSVRSAMSRTRWRHGVCWLGNKPPCSESFRPERTWSQANHDVEHDGTLTGARTML